MSKSYIRKRYEYMAITTPAAMGGMFFLSTAGYIYGLNSPQAMIAMPMVGGGLSLFGWVLYELQNLFNVKFSSTFSNDKPFFILNEEYDFIFRHKNLKIEVPKERLSKFCEVGIKRQIEFYSHSKTLHYPYYKRLSKNTVWAEKVFLDKNFLSEEVWSCKYILWKTGQFIEWNPYNQGKAGLASGTSTLQLVSKSQRRWNQ